MRDDSSPFRGLFVALFISLVVVFLVFAISSGHAPELTREQIRECQRYWERDEYCGALVSPPAKILIVDWIANNTDWLAALITACATVFIAYFTFTLKESTNNLWTATKASADAVPAIERAYIFLKVEGDNFGDSISEVLNTVIFAQPLPPPVIRWRLHNGGRTTAVMTEIRMAIEVGPQPSKPPFSGLPAHEYRFEFIRAADLTTEETTTHKEKLTREVALEITASQPTKWIFFCGEIDYENVLGDHCQKRFCLRWRTKGGFEPYEANDGQKYNHSS